MERQWDRFWTAAAVPVPIIMGHVFLLFEDSSAPVEVSVTDVEESDLLRDLSQAAAADSTPPSLPTYRIPISESEYMIWRQGPANQSCLALATGLRVRTCNASQAAALQLERVQNLTQSSRLLPVCPYVA